MKDLMKIAAFKAVRNLVAVAPSSKFKYATIMQVLSQASAIANYFSKSNYGSAHLNEARSALKITKGIETSCETRFSTCYRVTSSVRRCMPAIQRCVANGKLKFDTEAVRYCLNSLATLNKWRFVRLRRFML